MIEREARAVLSSLSSSTLSFAGIISREKVTCGTQYIFIVRQYILVDQDMRHMLRARKNLHR